MGSLTPRRGLPASVAGYFVARPRSGGGAGLGAVPWLPLGEVRRMLLVLLDRVDLGDEERSVVELYYGLHGLPLPFSSNLDPDIAAGRDESSPRRICRAALAALAPHVLTRRVAQPSGGLPARPAVNPILEPWFRAAVGGRDGRVDTIGRAYARALAECDGPHAGPTVAALHKWYADCGYVRDDLRHTRSVATGRRPNRRAMRRAAALMEVALFEEVAAGGVGSGRSATGRPRAVAAGPPIPSSGPLESVRAPVLVTHPDLAALVTAELSPTALLRAANALREQALDGIDVSGVLALLLRELRPRLHRFGRFELERTAVSVSYVATAQANPFLALEWLGHLLRRCGVTDRTFTILVNASEAASAAGFHRLATGTDGMFHRLRTDWDIPPPQLPAVELAESEQQRLIASSYRLEQMAVDRWAIGDTVSAITHLERSIAEAMTSVRMAATVLDDRAAFPARPVPDKAGAHGGDLTWPWYLGALHRTIEPLSRLHDEAIDRRLLTSDLRRRISSTARAVGGALGDYGEPITSNRFERWYHQVSTDSARLLAV